MLEITTTRHNPLVDPHLAVWSWEIPVYLFLGGIVAGMMVLAGINLIRLARGDDPKRFFSVQTPIFAMLLLSLGMGALFLDLAHKLYVWRVYVAFEPSSPMSWGSWVLLLVYPVLIGSALLRLPESWPWLARAAPMIGKASAWLIERPGVIRGLGWANVALGVALGIYTGILLNTMVARPLWNSAILGPLFLVSGLSAGAALIHLVTAALPRRGAPQGMIGGAIATLWQPLGEDAPPRQTAHELTRADLAFLVTELVLIGLLLANLYTSTASHATAAALITTGPYAIAFWGVVVGLGILVPVALQGLELGKRIPHTLLPALLVLVGGFTLRWVMVRAGQVSQVVQASLN
jgi:formate-dependent nitrite reductase membrane component NrfD